MGIRPKIGTIVRATALRAMHANPCVEPPVVFVTGVAIRYERGRVSPIISASQNVPILKSTELCGNRTILRWTMFDREPAVPMNGDLVITEIMFNPEDPRRGSEDVVRIQKIVQNGSSSQCDLYPYAA